MTDLLTGLLLGAPLCLTTGFALGWVGARAARGEVALKDLLTSKTEQVVVSERRDDEPELAGAAKSAGDSDA
jgi:hypothetical protein